MENALDLLRKHLGDATANSWLKPLHVVGFENGTLTFRAPTAFIGDWVKTHYTSRLITAWKAVGYEVKSLQVEIRNKTSAA